ncbi:hypothetical protein GTB64_004520 [Salmonella enterica]|nr:hypothetical protein [Salmonella enterica]
MKKLLLAVLVAPLLLTGCTVNKYYSGDAATTSGRADQDFFKHAREGSYKTPVDFPKDDAQREKQVNQFLSQIRKGKLSANQKYVCDVDAPTKMINDLHAKSIAAGFTEAQWEQDKGEIPRLNNMTSFMCYLGVIDATHKVSSGAFENMQATYEKAKGGAIDGDDELALQGLQLFMEAYKTGYRTK